MGVIPRGDRTPTPINEINFNVLTDSIGCEAFVGNISSALSSAMLLAAGNLNFSPSMIANVLTSNGAYPGDWKQLKTDMFDILKVNRGGFAIPRFETYDAKARVLNVRGEVVDGPMYAVNSLHNHNFLTGVLSFATNFADIFERENTMKPWALLTGLKGQGSKIPSTALALLEKLKDTDHFQISGLESGQRFKVVNPVLYQALAGFVSAGLVLPCGKTLRYELTDLGCELIPDFANRVRSFSGTLLAAKQDFEYLSEYFRLSKTKKGEIEMHPIRAMHLNKLIKYHAFLKQQNKQNQVLE